VSPKKRQLVRILSALFVVLITDQVSKAVIDATIPVGTETLAEHQGEFFWFTHRRNPGLVGGAFRNSPWIAYTLPVVATGFLVYLYRFLSTSARLQSIAYGMVGGGAIGNLIDRLFRKGGVVDFLQFHFHFIPFDFPWKQYPAFNIADSAICVGVILLIVTWRKGAPSCVPHDS